MEMSSNQDLQKAHRISGHNGRNRVHKSLFCKKYTGSPGIMVRTVCTNLCFAKSTPDLRAKWPKSCAQIAALQKMHRISGHNGKNHVHKSQFVEKSYLSGVADMFYEELKHIIRSVLEQGLGGQSLMEVLTANINPTEIYASDDMLVTDSYFSLLHYATGEEMLTDAEWKYFLDCLNGNRVYNLDEKLQMTDKNNIGGSV